ncbi:Tomoregulin-2 [Takifugu flavidus]|uniref:Tomoregulin-2 n=1 Tax=Takifugu flavidus TaxID=433684 RepID=A0A5C6PKZ7_9TELE|nr:Tomoregulin-2 [Takifugu flavidus]
MDSITSTGWKVPPTEGVQVSSLRGELICVLFILAPGRCSTMEQWIAQVPHSKGWASLVLEGQIRTGVSILQVDNTWGSVSLGESGFSLVGCKTWLESSLRGLDLLISGGQIHSSRVGFKPGFASYQAGTAFTKVSGTPGGEGSAETGQKETSTCDICQFGAECDVDAEDVWCVCNIDCSHISFNPVCASDGRSYDNPCQVKEASCQKQERIEVKHLGHCQGDIINGNKGRDGHFARTDLTVVDKDDPLAHGLYIPCPDHYKNYCVHGDCQFPNNLAQPSCSCHLGFRGPQCDIKESKDYKVLYVVPGSGKLHYVLIASIIGALQVVIICVVVLCITRKCPRTNRINRQKQNNVHFSSENTMRASTRLI